MIYIPQMASPILSYFHDPNQKIRFTAISSIYNIFTALGDDCLDIFTKTFKQLVCVIIDNSPDVRQAASHLNHTMKALLNDAILDHKVFDIKQFMMFINQNFAMQHPNVKQFLIDWINTLDQICQFQVSFYLPQFLRQLLYLLIHNSKSVKLKSQQCLKGFLHGFKEIYNSQNQQMIITKKLTKQDAQNILDILLQVLKESFYPQINIHALEWIDTLSDFLLVGQYQHLRKNSLKLTPKQKRKMQFINLFNQGTTKIDKNKNHNNGMILKQNQQKQKELQGKQYEQYKQKQKQNCKENENIIHMQKQQKQQKQQKSQQQNLLQVPQKLYSSISSPIKSKQKQQLAKHQNRQFFEPLFLSKFQNILFIVLKMISDQNQTVRKLSISINRKLLTVVTSKSAQKIDQDTVLMLPFILKQSKSPYKTQAIIKWITYLLRQSNQTILFQINNVIQRIIQKVCQKNGKNVVPLLQNSIFTQKYYDLLIQVLLSYIYEYPLLKIDIILRRIINLSNPNHNFLIICQKLDTMQIDPFRFIILDHLISILITQDFLKDLRLLIQTSLEFKSQNSSDKSMFDKLFPIFCSNQPALIALCFLGKRYTLIYQLFKYFSIEGYQQQAKISSFLKLVNLFQSPNMDFIRIQLMSFVENNHHKSKKNNKISLQKCYNLRKAYLALVMALPSGKSNRMLMKRLQILGLYDQQQDDCDESEQSDEQQQEPKPYLNYRQKQIIFSEEDYYQNRKNLENDEKYLTIYKQISQRIKKRSGNNLKKQ